MLALKVINLSLLYIYLSERFILSYTFLTNYYFSFQLTEVSLKFSKVWFSGGELL